MRRRQNRSSGPRPASTKRCLTSSGASPSARRWCCSLKTCIGPTRGHWQRPRTCCAPRTAHRSPSWPPSAPMRSPASTRCARGWRRSPVMQTWSASTSSRSRRPSWPSWSTTSSARIYPCESSTRFAVVLMATPSSRRSCCAVAPRSMSPCRRRCARSCCHGSTHCRTPRSTSSAWLRSGVARSSTTS